MKVPLVKVGNSRGIRIPKVIIEECGLGQEVNLEVKNQEIVITPTQKVRSGWTEAFKRMADSGDDELLDKSLVTDWDDKEWEWK